MLIFLLYFLCLGFLNVHLLESYYSLTLWTHLQFFDYNSCLKVFLLEPVSKPSWGELVSTGIFFSFSWLEILFSYLFACLSNFCALDIFHNLLYRLEVSYFLLKNTLFFFLVSSFWSPWIIVGLFLLFWRRSKMFHKPLNLQFYLLYILLGCLRFGRVSLD